ncbi:hypothetical protein EI94DRAFT_1705854 [Lactarius quietus]|nr:hypothetical protein EI94DRAFT_1705854 [Lactarius quietus]
MDVGLPEGGHSDSGMDLPPSPEDQISAESHEDQSFDDRSNFDMDDSPSPQSQYSFGINSMSLPEDEGHLGGSGGYFPNVHVHQTKHAPSQLDVMLGKEAKPHPGPRQLTSRMYLNPPGPVNTSEGSQKCKKGLEWTSLSPLRLNNQLVKAQQLVVSVNIIDCNTPLNSAATEVWKWGEPAPSSFTMEPPESATTLAHQEVHGDTPKPQQDDGITPMFRSILLLRDEMKRLCHVKNWLIDIYKRDLNLLAVMNQTAWTMPTCRTFLIGHTLRTMPVRDTNKNGHNALYMFTMVFMASLMLCNEMRRLHHINNEERQLYDARLNLIVAANRIVIMKENSAWPDRGHRQRVEANCHSMGQHMNFGSFIDQ